MVNCSTWNSLASFIGLLRIVAAIITFQQPCHVCKWQKVKDCAKVNHAHWLIYTQLLLILSTNETDSARRSINLFDNQVSNATGSFFECQRKKAQKLTILSLSSSIELMSFPNSLRDLQMTCSSSVCVSPMHSKVKLCRLVAKDLWALLSSETKNLVKKTR